LPREWLESDSALAGRILKAEARPQLRLFEEITRRRVSWIQETDEPTAMQPRTMRRA
jgi:hypothetical protein